MSNLDNYKSDTLMLIVGSNPLPNYVAAMLLAKDNARLVLIHTDKTEGFAHRIYDLVKAKRPGLRNPAFVEICEANRSRIIDALNDQLTPLIKERPNDVIGLNYTGGTKAMAAHTFDWVKNNVKAPVFSYLDSRTFQMFIDKKDDKVSSKAFPALESVKVSIPELMQLHDDFEYQKINDNIKKYPQFADASEDMFEFMKDNHEIWRLWCNKNLKRTDGRFISDGALKKAILPEGYMRKPFQFLSVGDEVTKLADAAKECDTDAKKLAGWLDGKWLEDYVLKCVTEIAEECGITDYCRNIDVNEPKNFEFDVAFMKGYQIFGLSCTTSDDKGLCKSKLFEAYIRTHQMGGDEARTALVCFYKDSLVLQNELEKQWEAKNKIKIFGRDKIFDLKEELKRWIFNVGEIKDE